MPSTDADHLYAVALAMLEDELQAQASGPEVARTIQTNATGHLAGLLTLAAGTGRAVTRMGAQPDGTVVAAVAIRPPTR